MIEFNTSIFWQIACSVLAILTAIVFSFECYVRKEYNKVVKKYLKLLDKVDEKPDLINATRSELSNLACSVKAFVEEHNSWHDRKIAFYFDHDGWHCCYDDEMPQGDTFIEQEEITQQTENKDENQG